jgi:wyosine [tRNA(Phe)-imidazoG37] synthetase (radical SAM superfamily)
MPLPIPLQQGILYGPVRSRRLGLSLGLNILPDEIKTCSLNCRYCQYSWTGLLTGDGRAVAGFLPSRQAIHDALQARLEALAAGGTPPDVLTFSGNGEATLHPDFPGIAADVSSLRDALAPRCRTAILSNSTTVHRADIRQALLGLDEPILKLDTGREETFRRLNAPAKGVTFAHILDGLQAMGNRAILQSLFVTGTVDNSTAAEVEAWVRAVAAIRPHHVQIYTLDRGTADRGLRPVDRPRLRAIGDALEASCGVRAEVFG